MLGMGTERKRPKLHTIVHMVAPSKAGGFVTLKEQAAYMDLKLVWSQTAGSGVVLIEEAKKYARARGKRLLFLESINTMWASDQKTCVLATANRTTSSGQFRRLNSYYKKLHFINDKDACTYAATGKLTPPGAEGGMSLCVDANPPPADPAQPMFVVGPKIAFQTFLDIYDTVHFDEDNEALSFTSATGASVTLEGLLNETATVTWRNGSTKETYSLPVQETLDRWKDDTSLGFSERQKDNLTSAVRVFGIQFGFYDEDDTVEAMATMLYTTLTKCFQM
jgi:hypothetical protein